MVYNPYSSGVSPQKFIVVFVFCCLFFEAVFVGSSYSRHNESNGKLLEEIKLRVSMDFASNQIAGEIQTPNTQRKHSYIKALNDYIKKQGWPLLVEEIRIEQAQAPKGSKILPLPSGAYVQYQNVTNRWYNHLSLIPVLAALLFCGLVFFRQLGVKIKASTPPVYKPNNPLAVLRIDLEKRQLTHIRSGNSADLANKPLCFYLALIEYCNERPDASLIQNKDLPPELLEYCEQFFHRLSDLGHAVRKRPDFNKNLEKTLSEIRASLDHVFAYDLEQKALFYPRKAIGEGSRSKVHNYVPPGLNKSQVDVSGLA